MRCEVVFGKYFGVSWNKPVKPSQKRTHLDSCCCIIASFPKGQVTLAAKAALIKPSSGLLLCKPMIPPIAVFLRSCPRLHNPSALYIDLRSALPSSSPWNCPCGRRTVRQESQGRPFASDLALAALKNLDVTKLGSSITRHHGSDKSAQCLCSKSKQKLRQSSIHLPRSWPQT